MGSLLQAIGLGGPKPYDINDAKSVAWHNQFQSAMPNLTFPEYEKIMAGKGYDVMPRMNQVQFMKHWYPDQMQPAQPAQVAAPAKPVQPVQPAQPAGGLLDGAVQGIQNRQKLLREM